MNRLSKLKLAAQATPHLLVPLTLFSEDHGVYQDYRHLSEWMDYLERATAADYFTIERMLIEAITHTCEVPVYTCKTPTYTILTSTQTIPC